MTIDNNLKLIEQLYNGTYEGVNLSLKFKDEIKEFNGDPWAWIKNRTEIVNYDGILIGDYIPFILSDGEVIDAQIAGIDTYFNTSNSEPGINHHIDFISKTTLAETFPFNRNETNNGTRNNENPWLASDLYSHLNTKIFNMLPAELKAVIAPKLMMMEKRFCENRLISESNGWQWKEAGLLWIPNEYEVYGSVCFGTPGYSSPQGIQYPLFHRSWKYRVKNAGSSGDRTYWWLMNPYHGDTNRICIVAIHGNTSRNICNNPNIRFPLCFRILSTTH